MAGHDLDQSELEQRLWKAIDETKIGMLGVAGGPPRHMQPMTGFCEKAGNTLWFFASNDSDLVRDVGEGHAGMFCFISKDREVYACLGGGLSLNPDRERIDRYWSPMVAAWYPQGKDDPALTLLRFDVADAQVWIAEKGPVRFAYEIAKANLTKTPPDEGQTAHLRFQ